MKRRTGILVIALCALVGAAAAQPGRDFPGDKKEKLDAMRVGFLTQRLDLSSEEAKVFWPVYNKYSDELQALRKNRRKALMDAREEFANMPDKDVEKLVDNEIAFRQNELDIMKKYHAQFKQVLPIKKVAILYKTEEEFKHELLQKLKDRRPMRDKN